MSQATRPTGDADDRDHGEWTLLDEIVGRFKATFRVKKPNSDD